jgi:hypothetical protein
MTNVAKAAPAGHAHQALKHHPANRAALMIVAAYIGVAIMVSVAFSFFFLSSAREIAAALCPFFHRSHSSAFCAAVNQIRDVTIAHLPTS